MSGGEIVGDIAQGMLTARAVEPGHGEAGGPGHTHEAACLNCGTALIGTHCHACGQAAHVHKTLGAFFHDLLHGVFHFEGKIWRTLPMLAWRPGRLTREYIDGRRASYISPIALFLFVVFVTFAVFNLLSTPFHFDGNNNLVVGEANATAQSAAEKRLVELRAKAAAALRTGQAVPGLEGQIAGAEAALAGIRAGKVQRVPDTIAKADTPSDQGLADTVNRGWRRVKANPELAIYKLQSTAYKYSWLLIPLSVPLLWLLFPFSRRWHLYDHTVFVTYSISFMLLLIGAVSLASFAGVSAAPLLLLYAPFHIYRQLRDAYVLSRRSALWRTAAMIVFSAIGISLFAAALLALVISE